MFCVNKFSLRYVPGSEIARTQTISTWQNLVHTVVRSLGSLQQRTGAPASPPRQHVLLSAVQMAALEVWTCIFPWPQGAFHGLVGVAFRTLRLNFFTSTSYLNLCEESLYFYNPICVCVCVYESYCFHHSDAKNWKYEEILKRLLTILKRMLRS